MVFVSLIYGYSKDDWKCNVELCGYDVARDNLRIGTELQILVVIKHLSGLVAFEQK